MHPLSGVFAMAAEKAAPQQGGVPGDQAPSGPVTPPRARSPRRKQRCPAAGRWDAGQSGYRRGAPPHPPKPPRDLVRRSTHQTRLHRLGRVWLGMALPALAVTSRRAVAPAAPAHVGHDPTLTHRQRQGSRASACSRKATKAGPAPATSDHAHPCHLFCPAEGLARGRSTTAACGRRPGRGPVAGRPCPAPR
jgi:hypothetical protein